MLGTVSTFKLSILVVFCYFNVSEAELGFKAVKKGKDFLKKHCLKNNAKLCLGLAGAAGLAAVGDFGIDRDFDGIEEDFDNENELFYELVDGKLDYVQDFIGKIAEKLEQFLL